ncbi:FKBP-type peptidyl-prolyl cis-trans isomerase [Sediminitomix flava]|uniref:Peptidyl-prolyl cis-trans isomerase n=1 Tax=Sediminitomix flava TaxID=379075 RepID=A0A315ZH75_SEDFL|nr:FKBP-type peptidyl-prolyl cis-trans isomerase [Sediminitomix flava]PWJ44490.1 FKBP-type peptidyl-prolyl isomerase-like protein [Sediminitomix flava]
MRAFILLLFISQLSFFSVYAQCEDCAPTTEDIDYCFTDARFGIRCAQFIEKSDYFIFSTKKSKSYKLPIIKEGENHVDYLLTQITEKTAKLSAIDVLFLEVALETWNVEKTKIGFDFTDSGLGIKILEQGNGDIPAKGDEIVVHYKGMLENGEVFDSSYDRGTPLTFPIGVGRVIDGWDEGLTSIPVGTKAILRIPPEIGYGERSIGRIPANSTLYFEVELIDIVD